MATVELHHEVTGPPDAPLLVLGASLGTTGEMWDPVLAPLAERLRVVRIDLRGHGRSPAPAGPYALEDLGRDVVALLDRLGAERAHYAGLSLGGMVGMWLGAFAPERIDRLALLCTTPYLGPVMAERAAEVRRRGSTAGIAGGVVANWLTAGFAAGHPEVRDRLHSMLVASPAEGYAACCEAIAGMDLRGDLPRIRAPTLVVAGAHDTVTPPDVLRGVADAIPGARFELLRPAAHVAVAERPADAARLLLDHLA